MPQGKGMCLEQQHQFDNDRADFFAHAASMALDEILLQGAQLIGRDVLAAQRAETGSNSIQRFFGPGNLPVQIVPAFLYPLFGFGSQFQLQVLIDNAFDEVESELTRTYVIDIVHTFSS